MAVVSVFDQHKNVYLRGCRSILATLRLLSYRKRAKRVLFSTQGRASRLLRNTVCARMRVDVPQSSDLTVSYGCRPGVE